MSYGLNVEMHKQVSLGTWRLLWDYLNGFQLRASDQLSAGSKVIMGYSISLSKQILDR